MHASAFVARGALSEAGAPGRAGPCSSGLPSSSHQAVEVPQTHCTVQVLPDRMTSTVLDLQLHNAT